MNQLGSKTEQLIYRTSYRKHRERLADIRHNITANHYLPPKHPYSSKKLYQKDDINKGELESDISIWKNKANAMKSKSNHKIGDFLTAEELKRQQIRYIEGKLETKIEVTSELKEGDCFKLVVPSAKTNPLASSVKSKEAGVFTKMSSIEKSYKKFTSHSVTKDNQRDNKSTKQREILYNLPERNENRTVIHKKTLVLSSMQSCLLELCLINERLLIVAYLMGAENVTLRELFSPKRTSDILRDYQNNYESLCSCIVIEKTNNKYKAIRLIPKEELKEKVTSEDKNKQKVKIQNQFIKRNYYTIAKAEEEAKNQQKEKEKPAVNSEYVQSIVERLAAPKRLYKLRDEKLDRIQRQQRVVSNYTKLEPKIYQNSQEQLAPPQPKILIKSHNETLSTATKQKPLQINPHTSEKAEELYQQLFEQYPQDKAKLNNVQIRDLDEEEVEILKAETYNNIAKVHIEESEERYEDSNDFQAETKEVDEKQKDKNVEIKEIQNDEEEYGYEEFDNPSGMKNSSSAQKQKIISHKEAPLQSHTIQKIIEEPPKHEINNEGDVYDNEFEKQAEENQEIYEQSFENNSGAPESPAKALKIPQVAKIEEEYLEEQFST